MYLAWRVQDQTLIRLKQEVDMAASKSKQAAQDLQTITAELTSAARELQSKQSAAAELDHKLAASQHELDSLTHSVHALHAEHDAAQCAHAQIQSQLVEAQAHLDSALLQQGCQRRQQHQDSNGGCCSTSEIAGRLPQTDLQTQEGEVRTAVARQGSAGLSGVPNIVVAADQERSPQASTPSWRGPFPN